MTEVAFLRLARKFFRSDVWNEPREFSRAEAWLDLIQMASISRERRIIDNAAVDLNRGELVASLRYLASRWKWSKSKVERFYAYLVESNRITLASKGALKVVKLSNYHRHNPLGTIENKGWDSNRDTNEDTNEDTKRDTKRDSVIIEPQPDNNSSGTQNGTENGTLAILKSGHQTGQSIRSTERIEEPYILSGGEKAEEKAAHYHRDTRTALHLLNEAAGVHYREVDSNLKIISARLKEPGVDIEGVRKMINRQCQIWKGTDYGKYLRPETLFRQSKFDGYYAARDQPIIGPRQAGPDRNAGVVGGADIGRADRIIARRKAESEAATRQAMAIKVAGHGANPQ